MKGLKVYSGSALDMPVEIEDADLLIYKHIFEHFYDPHAAVKAATEHLAPGGYVLVEVPNASQFNSFPKHHSPLHYLVLEHISHFDQHHLEELFAVHEMVLQDTMCTDFDKAEDYPVPIML